MSAPPPVPRSRRSAQTLGPYEVLARIARGGMGTVYLARRAGEAGFQRLFAIKVMHAHLAEDQAFVEMLRDEARIAARLHHPNVVPVLDLGTQGDVHFVVMEYVEGCALASLLRHNPERRPPELLVAIAVDTLEGLHAAHVLTDDDGVLLHLVHRDVSPQNVLVGVDGVARITDFGVAKAESRITSTQPGTRKGKLAYMAPEQMMASDDVDHRADVFALGAVLWSALTGEQLFHGATDGETLHNLLNRKVPPPSTVGLRPPEWLDAPILKALEREPDRRFGSAQEMADALRDACIRHARLAPRRAVADWVNESFGAEFEQRRQVIRTAARKRELSVMEESSLPAIPSLSFGGAPEPSSTPSAVESGPATPSTDRGVEASGAHPIPGSATPLPAGTVGATVASARPPGPRARWPFLAGGALLAVVAAGAMVMKGGSDREPATTVSAAPRAALPASAGLPTEPAPPPQERAPAVADPSPGTTAQPPAPAASSDAPAVAPAPPARPRGAARPAVRVGSPPSGGDAPPASPPAGIERNPYLKR